MIELFFITCWTGVTLLMGNILRNHSLGGGRIYMFLGLSCFYLTGLFASYPMVLKLIGKM